MLKRILVHLTNDENIDNLLEYAKGLQDNSGGEVFGLYVKDIRKYELLTPAIEGIMIDNSSNYVFGEWEKFEEKCALELKEKFEKIFGAGKIYIDDGITSECVLERLKGFDLLVVSKGKKVNQDLKVILKMVFKPVLCIPDTKNKFPAKVLMADDNHINANKSITNFIKLFDKNKIVDIIRVNIEEASGMLEEYLKSYEIESMVINREGDPLVKILEASKGYDLIVMGNLKYFFMVEKITGKTGANLMEKIDKPLFIG